MYTIASITQTCFGCPSQWEGKTEDGKYIYMRFRWGHLRLDINDETVASMDVGENEWSGIISLEDALIHLKEHLSMSPEAMKEYYKLFTP